jgi:CRISPR-associated protein Cas5h
MGRLISVDLKATFGFLKKPDINEGIYLPYNLLHNPGFLGILGAIAGLTGYQQQGELPEYYQRLRSLKIALRPLRAEKGLFEKTALTFNNSVGYASHEEGGNLLVTEQILVRPQFRCYLHLEPERELHQHLRSRLQNHEAEFVPYLGKNEHSLWWENFKEYELQPFIFDRDFSINSIFMKGKEIIKDIAVRRTAGPFFMTHGEPQFASFEELPVGFDERLFQYRTALFIFSNFKLPKEAKLDNLYQLSPTDEIIQLF